jgi:hypothetical protein
MWITYIWTTHISTASKGHELPQMSTLDYSKVKFYHRQTHSLHFVGLGYAFSVLNMLSVCWKSFSAGLHWQSMSFLVVNSEYNKQNTPYHHKIWSYIRKRQKQVGHFMYWFLVPGLNWHWPFFVTGPFLKLLYSNCWIGLLLIFLG